MQKRVWILFGAILIMLVGNIVLNQYTSVGYSTSTSQGTINLIIESSCGDGSCNGGETCSTCPADCGSCPVDEDSSGGGGGGGGIDVSRRNFSIDREVIRVMTRAEESFKTSFKITNTGSVGQNFVVLLSPSLEELVFVSEDSFYIAAGEEKTIDLTFISTNDTVPDVYSGNIKVKTSYEEKEVQIVYSVRSQMILFDISLEIPSKYKNLFPGDELFLQLTLFNLGVVGKTDVLIEYMIKDFDGNVVLEESDVVGVETQVSFSRTLRLPLDLRPGDYVAIAQVRYESSVGSSSVLFHVLEEEKPLRLFSMKNLVYIIPIILAVIFAILFILFLIYERKKMIGMSRVLTNVRKTKKVY